MGREPDLWEGEYTHRSILTNVFVKPNEQSQACLSYAMARKRRMKSNDYESSMRDIMEFYNMRGGKERIFDDMNNGVGWGRLPKSFMAENTVFLFLTALIRNFYKAIMLRIEVKKFGLKETSRIKAFVFKFISVPAKWIKTARQHALNIYTDNHAYAEAFKTSFG